MKLTLIQVFVFRFMLRSDVNMLQVQRNYISLDHVRFLETERYSLMRLHMPLNALRATSTKVENVAKNTSGVLLRRYSGFNFSHYDLPFPTRYCIPFVRSGLCQLVIRVKGFRVSAHDLDSHSVLSIGVDTTLSRESSCVSLAHGPRGLFLLSCHRKTFLLLLIRSLL